ncbi:MAG: hypothetical protein ACLP9S_07565 [Syntrophales bacterium]
MLVVISDLHFQDTRNDAIFDEKNHVWVNVDRNVSADAFYKVFEELFSVARTNKAKEIIVVLAGDIFDLNRSSRWQLTEYRPYGDETSPPDKWGPVALDILSGIVKSNQETFDVFKSLIRQQSHIASELNKPEIPFELIYIPGNHDRIANLYAPLGKEIRKVLGLGGTGGFAHEYFEDSYGVHIRHGHEYDKYNFAGDVPKDGPFKVADKDYDIAPLGDYVTIDIATGLAFKYGKTYKPAITAGDTKHQAIYCKLLEFDDLRPQSDMINFLESEAIADVWEDLTPVADEIVKRALNSKFLRSKFVIWGKIFPVLKVLPTRLIPTRFIINLISRMKSTGPQIWEFAKREPALNLSSNKPTFLYAVSGHTHNPDVEFLHNQRIGRNDQQYFFFDTGTWRQQIRKCCGEQTFSQAKALTYVVFYRSDEDTDVKAGEKGYSFDYWSGFTRKEITI